MRHLGLLGAMLLLPCASHAWERCNLLNDGSTSWYATSALVTHNGKVYFVAEEYIAGMYADEVTLDLVKFQGTYTAPVTTTSGCPTGVRG